MLGCVQHVTITINRGPVPVGADSTSIDRHRATALGSSSPRLHLPLPKQHHQVSDGPNLHDTIIWV